MFRRQNIRFCAVSSQTQQFLSFLESDRGQCTSSVNTRRENSNNATSATSSSVAMDTTLSSSPSSSFTHNNEKNWLPQADGSSSRSSGGSVSLLSFSCSVCGKRFSTEGSLVKHTQSRHQAKGVTRKTKEEKKSNDDKGKETTTSSNIQHVSSANSSSLQTMVGKWSRLVMMRNTNSTNINLKKSTTSSSPLKENEATKSQAPKKETSKTTETVDTQTEKMDATQSKSESSTQEQQQQQQEMKKDNVTGDDTTKQTLHQQREDEKPVVVDKVEAAQQDQSVSASPTNETTTGEDSITSTHQQQHQHNRERVEVTLTDDDRRDLLAAQLDIVETTCETLIAWAQRNEARKRARHKLNNLVFPPEEKENTSIGAIVNNNDTSSSSSYSNFEFPAADPFYVSKRHPWGGGDFVSCVSAKERLAQRNRELHALMKQQNQQNNNNNNNSATLKSLLQQPMTSCDVGGMTSCSLIGVVTDVKTGTMKSLTASSPTSTSSESDKQNNNDSSSNKQQKVVPLQRATILELSCRNFQCEKLSGRVSMIKNNIKVRIRYTRHESHKLKKKALRGGHPKEYGEALWNVGDVLYCRGQLQLHALYDLASKRWKVSGLVVDICRNTGDVVKISEVNEEGTEEKEGTKDDNKVEQ